MLLLNISICEHQSASNADLTLHKHIYVISSLKYHIVSLEYKMFPNGFLMEIYGNMIILIQM